MPKFPSKEVDISTLAYTMIMGYFAHGAEFPSVGPLTLFCKRRDYITARNARSKAAAAVQLATVAKDNTLQSLSRLMKSCLKKSQVDVTNDPQKLAQIGWGLKAPPSPADPPGQPRELNCLTQGKGSILLKWNHPAGGGAVRNYIIEKRELLQDNVFGSWRLVGTALNTTICLTCQRQAVQLEYHVKAVNKADESIPSNTVAVVL